MKPHLLIFETQAQDEKLADNLYDIFKDDMMINPFTFMYSSLEDLSKKLKDERIKNILTTNNTKFIVTQISEHVLLRNCDNIEDSLRAAEVQVFPCL